MRFFAGLASAKVCLAVSILAFGLMETQHVLAQSQIVAIAKQENHTNIRLYDSSGAPIVEFAVQAPDNAEYLSGAWDSNSSLALLIKSGNDRVIRFFDTQGTVVNELSLSGSSINTVLSSDVDGNGSDELIAIEQNNSRAIMHIFHNPASPAFSKASITLGAAGTYYSAAVLGNKAAGVFAYAPKASGSSALSKVKAKRAKRKKKKGSKKKAPASNSKFGIVRLIDFQGNIVSSVAVKSGADAQIFPVSVDGTAGFLLRDGSQVKVFKTSGQPSGSHSIFSDGVIVTGDFSGSGTFRDLLISEGNTLRFIDLVSGTTRDVELQDFSDQVQDIERQIEIVTEQLLEAYRSGNLNEVDRLREKLIALQQGKQAGSTEGRIAPSLIRLFTGGAGAIEGVCDVVHENPHDGYGGFLIKNSDKDGRIVVLTPGGRNYVKASLLKFGSYKKITDLKDAGYGNPDSSGLRKHFRGSAPVQRYGKFIFRAQLQPHYYDKSADGELHCWFVKSPSSRVD
ncbi:MAG: hypothetical protein J5J00_07915 [Deltaproteobacteria bacterium]|nr:hypothetical protein [Deltaproteobacteria bacterium]